MVQLGSVLQCTGPIEIITYVRKQLFFHQTPQNQSLNVLFSHTKLYTSSTYPFYKNPTILCSHTHLTYQILRELCGTSIMAYNVLLRSFLLFLSSFILSFNFLEAQMVPAVFVFGDSLVDVGNNNYLKVSLAKADFPHNGIDFPTKKPTGRFTNGKNAADFLGTLIQTFITTMP